MKKKYKKILIIGVIVIIVVVIVILLVSKANQPPEGSGAEALPSLPEEEAGEETELEKEGFELVKLSDEELRFLTFGKIL